jgi:hypothetical protein
MYKCAVVAYVCIHAYICAHTNTCVYTYIHTCTHTHMNWPTHKLIHVQQEFIRAYDIICTHTHTHTHVYTHTHTYVHEWANKQVKANKQVFHVQEEFIRAYDILCTLGDMEALLTVYVCGPWNSMFMLYYAPLVTYRLF